MNSTTIGPNTTVEGRLEGDEDVLVEGRIEGTIELTESLTIAESGYVKGEVSARNVFVQGTVEGVVRATELLHIAPSAKVKANLATPSLRIEDGAQVSGEVDMDLDAVPTATKKVTSSAKPSRAISSAPKSSPKKPATKAVNSSAASTTTTTVVVDDEDYDEFTVKELRDRLRELDLSIKGTKAELIARLQEA